MPVLGSAWPGEEDVAPRSLATLLSDVGPEAMHRSILSLPAWGLQMNFRIGRRFRDDARLSSCCCCQHCGHLKDLSSPLRQDLGLAAAAAASPLELVAAAWGSAWGASPDRSLKSSEGS